MVSVNVLNWNGRKFLKACLESIFKQTYPEIELTVIDNASSDNSVEFIKANYPLVRLVENRKNLGFSGGHNLGIRKSKGNFVLCLNPDVIMTPNFVSNLVEVAEGDEKIGAVTGKLIWSSFEEIGAGKKSNIIDSTGHIIFKDRHVLDRGQGEKDQRQFENQAEVFSVCGAAPMYRRKALENAKINGEYFDEDMFAYKEDIDVGWRLRLLGWKCVYAPKASAYHARGWGVTEKKQGFFNKFRYFKIKQARGSASPFLKHLSFRNRHIMMIKNELPLLFLKHLPWILFYEFGIFFYACFFERGSFRAIPEILRLWPKLWQKRREIMARRKIGAREMERWFR